jgi:hypothetical protein
MRAASAAYARCACNNGALREQVGLIAFALPIHAPLRTQAQAKYLPPMAYDCEPSKEDPSANADGLDEDDEEENKGVCYCRRAARSLRRAAHVVAGDRRTAARRARRGCFVLSGRGSAVSQLEPDSTTRGPLILRAHAHASHPNQAAAATRRRTAAT